MTKRTTNVLCDSLDDFGRGIVRLDGKAVFVEDLLPGERGVLETSFRYGKLSEAKLVERLNDSPDRVRPACPYYPSCGGCQIMHLDYRKQLLFKQRKVAHLLRKFAKIDVPVEETIGLDEPSRYRNKVQKPLRNVRGHLCAGFFRKNSHDLVPVKDCLAESALSTRITATVLSLCEKFGYEAYDEDRRTGSLRHLLIKTSTDQKQALVTLIVTDDRLPGRKDFAKALIAKVPEIRGVVFNVNPRKTNVILGPKDVPIYGATRIHDTIFGQRFGISTQSFYQTNSFQIEKLYQTAIDLARPEKTDRVLDAYCGTGTIGLSIAGKVRSVLGVEIVPDAVRDAIENAKANGIANARFLCGDCTEYMQRTDETFDLVLLDPPRKGSTPEFLAALKRMAPKKVVYVSCDPATLARDLASLKEDYLVEKVVPVDMFPNTLHVETVVGMRRK